VNHTAMLGGEESGGFAFGTHLPERDAFLAALYILDLMQRRGADIAGLKYGVQIRTGAWHYQRRDVPVPAEEIDAIRAHVAALDTSAVDLGGTPVTKTVTLDGVKMIGEDRRWLLIRTSGTEPLARIYAEAGDPQTVEMLLDLGQTLLRENPVAASTALTDEPGEPVSEEGETAGAAPARAARTGRYTRRR
jgi:phosphomannomutase